MFWSPWKRAKRGGRIGLRCEARDEFLDLPNGFVLGACQHVCVILRGEMSLQAMNAAQVNFAAFDHTEKDGKSAGGARGTDALAGGGLGHIIATHEKLEQRRITLPGPKFASIDDLDVPEQARNAVLILPHQLAEFAE